MHKVNIPKAELEELYFTRQLSVRDLCKHYRHDAKTLLKLFREYGIILRSGREAWVVRRRFKTRPLISRERLSFLYAAKENTSYVLADILGIRARTRRNYLRRYGIKSKSRCPHSDTSIERLVEQELASREVGHYKQFCIGGFCIADKAFPDEKIAVFCDGTYWHSRKHVVIKDKRVNRRLVESGWVVLRFSEHQINRNIKAVVDTLLTTLERRRKLIWAHVPENGRKRGI